MPYQPTALNYDERTRQKNLREKRMREARYSAAEALSDHGQNPTDSTALLACVAQLRNLLTTMATPRQKELVLKRYPGVLPSAPSSAQTEQY